MPTIEVSKKDLESLVGKKFSEKELSDAMLFVKGEIDKIEGDLLVVDVKETNRPDLWSTEGIANELALRLGLKTGEIGLKINPPAIEIIVDEASTTARPKVAGALAKGVKLNDEALKQLIQLQEKVCQTFGRKRKEAAMGVYEIDKLSLPIHYKGFLPTEKKFVPLDFDKEMTLEQIIKVHPKGKEYGHLISGAKKYPVWLDSKGTIASLPPIINSETTGRVTTSTKNIFIEVSGFDQEIVNTTLLVICRALAKRGAKIFSAKVRYGKKTIVTPQNAPKKITFPLEYAQKIFGEKLSGTHATVLLKRAGFDAKIKGKNIEATYQSHRKDILHHADVVEDLLISHGYNNFTPQKIEYALIGKELPSTNLVNAWREACIGLGLQEALTYNLTSKEKQAQKTGLLKEEFVEIENPMSSNYEIFRKNIFPEILEFLSTNKKAAFPHKVFEIGKTLCIDQKTETGVKETDRVCIVISDRKADYTLAKSLLENLCANFGLEPKVMETSLPFLEKGKSAQADLGNGKKAFFGEVSEKTLKEFKVEEKTIVIEIDLK